MQGRAKGEGRRVESADAGNAAEALTLPPSPFPLPAQQGTVLAFDFGTKRIGVAVGETLLGRAKALTTIALEANAARFAAIDKLIAEWQPIRLVVGLPLSADGEPHEMTARAERFCRQLEARYPLPVTPVDERFSSTEAEARLAERGLNWKQRKETLDAEAAATILQGFFDAQAQ